MWANPWIILALAHNGEGFWGLGLYKPPVNMEVAVGWKNGAGPAASPPFGGLIDSSQLQWLVWPKKKKLQ